MQREGCGLSGYAQINTYFNYLRYLRYLWFEFWLDYLGLVQSLIFKFDTRFDNDIASLVSSFLAILDLKAIIGLLFLHADP